MRAALASLCLLAAAAPAGAQALSEIDARMGERIAALGAAVERLRTDEGFHVVVWGRAWLASPGGSFRFDDDHSGVVGTEVDVPEDLDLGRDVSPEAGLDFTFGPHRIGASYLSLRFRGDEDLSQAIVIDDTTFVIGARVASELDLTLVSARYDYAVVAEEPIDVRLGAKVYGFDIDAEVESDVPPLRESRSLTGALPALTAAVEWRVTDALLLQLGAAGLTVGSGRNFFDFEAAAGVRLGGSIDLVAGYRWLRVDVRASEREANFTVDGPFLGVAIRF